MSAPVQPTPHRRLAPTGLRSKVIWAFLLMSAVPIVMLIMMSGWFAFPYVREFYHLDRYFPMIIAPTESTWWILMLILLTTFISLLGGVYLAIRIVQPIIAISHGAKQLAEGGFDQQLTTREQDEIGDLTSSLNQLTARIRANMTDLKSFGEQTTKMNLEIQNRLVTLSGLLQISESISHGTDINVVLDVSVERLAALDGQGFSFLCVQPIEELAIAPRRMHGIEAQQLQAVAFVSSKTVIDGGHPPTSAMAGVWEQLGRPSLIIQPVTIRGRLMGMLGVGNRQPGYTWSNELIDLVALFAKQVCIALENELLVRKTKQLAIRDELTGAYNERYIRQRLSEEIKRAIMYQRPCAFVMLTLPGYAAYRRQHGEPEAERVLKRVVQVTQEALTEVDRIGRFAGNEIAVVLPERNKRQAQEAAEGICKRIALAFEAAAPGDRLTALWGMGENPIDGVTAEALIDKASAMLRANDTAVAPGGHA